MARSLLVTRRDPVALLMDADTVDASRAREQERVYFDLLRPAAQQTPFRLFLAVPELEIVFLETPYFAPQIAANEPDSETLRMTRPKHRLEQFLSSAGFASEKAWIETLDETAIQSLAEHPLFVAVIAFVRRPQKWHPSD